MVRLPVGARVPTCESTTKMSHSHLIQFPGLFKGSASMYSKGVPPIQRVFEASGRIEVHATITKDVCRVSLSRQANRQCTLHQFEALT